VPPDLPLDRFVDEYVYRHRHSAFPVVEGDRVLGFADTKGFRSMSREKRGSASVSDLLVPASPSNSVDPDQDSLDAFTKMRKNGLRRLLVVSPSGHLEGVLSLSDLAALFELKLELEDAGQDAASAGTAPDQ
jgi:CBS domain-containing protein